MIAMLMDLLNQQLEYAREDGERFLDAVQNAAHSPTRARSYRFVYYGSVASWNLRDQHMFAGGA